MLMENPDEVAQIVLNLIDYSGFILNIITIIVLFVVMVVVIAIVVVDEDGIGVMDEVTTNKIIVALDVSD